MITSAIGPAGVAWRDPVYSRVSADRTLAELLGPGRVRLRTGWPEFGSDKRWFLLAYLAVRGSWMGRDRLAHLFWPSVPPTAARDRFRQLLRRTQAKLHVDGLEALRTRVRWLVETDLSAFNGALASADDERAFDVYTRPHMATAHGMGRRTLAVEAYMAFADRIREELDLQPSSATRSLAEAIRRSDAEAPSPGRRPGAQDTAVASGAGPGNAFVGRVFVRRLGAFAGPRDCWARPRA